MRIAYLGIATALSCALLGWAGCGIGGTDGLFGGSGPTGQGGDTSGSGGTGGRGGQGGSTTSSGEGGRSATASSANASSSGSSVPDGVMCNGAPCAVGDVCCHDLFNSNQDHCGQDPCGGGQQVVALSCDGPEDCPQGVCCGAFNSQVQDWTSIHCAMACDGNETIMCKADGDCGAGLTCKHTQALGMGWGFCGS